MMAKKTTQLNEFLFIRQSYHRARAGGNPNTFAPKCGIP
jgi:hypothetical protein